MSSTILITGGAGFIGSHLADDLLEHWRVRALDNLTPQVHETGKRPGYLHPDVELVVGDVRDGNCVRRALDGVGDFPAYKWREIAPHLPGDLSGARALDIGCNAGFYSFELARRGADVLAVDVDEHYLLRQARWAADELGLQERVEFLQTEVYELGELGREPFDVVLFLGVLYHLRHPLLALDIVSALTRDVLVVQTLTMPGDERVEIPADLSIDERDDLLRPGWPTMAFVEHELAGDPTNCGRPTRPASRRCCAPAACRSRAAPGTRSGFVATRVDPGAQAAKWRSRRPRHG